MKKCKLRKARLPRYKDDTKYQPQHSHTPLWRRKIYILHNRHRWAWCKILDWSSLARAEPGNQLHRLHLTEGKLHGGCKQYGSIRKRIWHEDSICPWRQNDSAEVCMLYCDHNNSNFYHSENKFSGTKSFWFERARIHFYFLQTYLDKLDVAKPSVSRLGQGL